MNSHDGQRSGRQLPVPYWTIAWTTKDLAPDRFLGVLRELPPPEEQRTGDWCELVHVDLSERWTLVVVDPTEGVPPGASEDGADRSATFSRSSEAEPGRRSAYASEGAAPTEPVRRRAALAAPSRA